MTKLTDSQLALMESATQAKYRAEIRVEELTANFKEAVVQAEAPLRQAILDMALAGVPIRQIGRQVLNTLDYATVRKYLPEQWKDTAAPVVKGAPKPKSPGVIEELSENLIIVWDSATREWEFTTFDFDGFVSVERSAHTDRGNQTAADPVPKDVVATLKKRYPKSDLEFDKEE